VALFEGAEVGGGLDGGGDDGVREGLFGGLAVEVGLEFVVEGAGLVGQLVEAFQGALVVGGVGVVVAVGGEAALFIEEEEGAQLVARDDAVDDGGGVGVLAVLAVMDDHGAQGVVGDVVEGAEVVGAGGDEVARVVQGDGGDLAVEVVEARAGTLGAFLLGHADGVGDVGQVAQAVADDVGVGAVIAGPAAGRGGVAVVEIFLDEALLARGKGSEGRTFEGVVGAHAVA
jgi:hypothetical protein